MRRLLLSLLALATFATAQNRVPTAAEIDSAQPAAIRALSKRILATVGGDVGRAASELLAAAFDSDDHATRYLLWQEAIGLAERTGEAWLARSYIAAMANDFGVDTVQAGVDLLQRMAASTEDKRHIAKVALAAMYAADGHGHGDEKAMLKYFDVAVRAAFRFDHAPLYVHVRDRLAFLRAPIELGESLQPTLAESPWQPTDVAAALLRGSLYTLEPYSVRELAPLFGGLGNAGELDVDREARSLTGEELLQLANCTSNAHMRSGWLRLARNRLAFEYRTASAERRRAICTSLVTAVEQLAQHDGLTRLRFRKDADLAQLAIQNGEWSIADGQLRGQAAGNNNFATHRVRFTDVYAAVIRGGIRSEAGLNFRCNVGDVNLLLNWEVEPQNHLWLNGACHRNGPPALTQGEQHTILFFHDGHETNVCIDGEHMWTVPTRMQGTVSIYPALGSEIFVQEILIDGDPDGLVDAPAGTLM